MKYLIGLDGGNTSVKAVIFDENGKAVAQASTAMHHLEPRGKGFMEYSVEELASAAYSCIRKAVEKAGIDGKDVAGIGVTSFGNGCLVIGENGETIAPGVFSQDYRANDIVDRFFREGIADKIIEIGKGLPFAGQPGAILRWYKENQPEVYEKIGHILMFKDYIVYKLTGEIAADANNFGGSNLLDIEKVEYSRELMELFGVPEMYDKLPKLAIEPTEIVGYVTEEAAEQTGLVSGIPVVAGMMDITACLVGAGATEEGVFTAVGGSWSINLAHSKNILPNINGNLPYIKKGEYLHGSWSGASGSNYEWFKNALGGEAKLIAGENGDYFKVLDDLISSVDINTVDVFFHPFVAQPSVHPDARGNFFNIELNTTYAEMAYAVAEGIAFIHKYHIDILRDRGLEPKKIRFTGGIARSKVIAQIFANVLEVPIESIDCDEVGASGCAITAGVAAGVYKDYDDAFARAVKVLPAIKPNPETFEVYRARYKEWSKLVEVMKNYWDYKQELRLEAAKKDKELVMA